MAWSKETRIIIMLGIDAAFFFLELGVGVAVGSLALMADAFHMLNDIISLAVGLWAVRAAQKSSTDKYSFGWLRAEILGAFFNAVFLIALCLSIVLEAFQRLLDPPSISNPKLILIVGCLGLASNLAGFFVLGGHGHSHGPEGHDHEHGHDEISSAEEGHAHGPHDHTHEVAEENISTTYQENLAAKVKSKQGNHIRFSSSDDASTLKDSTASPSRSSKGNKKHRRRASSIRSGRFGNIDEMAIHPASFRQNIIAAVRAPVDGNESEDSPSSDVEDDTMVEEDRPTENSPLLSKSTTKNGSHSHDHSNHSHSHPSKSKPSQEHAGHNHLKPRKAASGGHGHSHGDMGMNGMILHVIGDALGNVGVIVAALIIWLTEWSGKYYADPAVSLFITLIIIRSALPLTAATAKILLQATPDHIDVKDIKEDIQALPGVLSCHHVHIWQLSDTQVVASMHLQVTFPISEASGERYMELARQARECLHAYGIHSATIQPEFCTDKAHDHTEGAVMSLDGIVGQARCRLDDDLCLLECVDDCKGKGCCPTTSSSASTHSHSHSEHEGHSHH